MAFTLPDLSGQTPIVDPKTGIPTAYFTDWVARVLRQIIAEDTNQDNLIASLQAVQQQLLAQQAQMNAAIVAIQQAQATADAAGGTGAQSGQAQGEFDALSTSSWTHGPVVSLTGVTAGHLTIFGSGPTQNNNTGVNAISGVLGQFDDGQWRIVEVIGGIDTVVFNSGTYHAERDRDDQGVENILYNTTDTSSVSIARSTTGAMDYRLDFNAPSCDITACLLQIYVRRGA